jgi:glucuronide carrier protein
MHHRPLTWRNIVGYGLGDVANNFAFAMGALFLLHYYTDVAGIGAAAAGSLLMLVRIYDALMDIVAGRVVDRTTTRWGSFRPYLLWGACPLMLLSVAVFSVPANWEATPKLLYAYVTYALLGTAYSFVNIPYGALSTAMTQAPRERSWLGASRTLLATCTFALIALVIAPKRRHAQGVLEAQNELTQTTAILAATGIVLYALCFAATRENVPRRIKHPDLKNSLATLRHNRALATLCLGAICVQLAVFSMSASYLYLARYVLGDTALFVPIVVTTGLLAAIIAPPITPWLVRKHGKKCTFLLGTATAAVFSLLLLLAPVVSKPLLFGLLASASTGKIIAMSVMWALEADCVEYGEWTSGLRIEGMTYAVFSFTRKCGQALGGSIPAFLLAASNYVPNAIAQTDGARFGILCSVSLVPACAFASAFAIMCFFPLTDDGFARLLSEIEAKRHSRRPPNTKEDE